MVYKIFYNDEAMTLVLKWNEVKLSRSAGIDGILFHKCAALYVRGVLDVH